MISTLNLLLIVLICGLHPSNEMYGSKDLEEINGNNISVTEVSNFENKACPPHVLMSLGAIRFYQMLISPSRRGLSCPMIPHCSEYAYQAFKRYGFIAGYVMTTDRLFRCGRDLEKYTKLSVNDTMKYVDYPPGMAKEGNGDSDYIVQRSTNQFRRISNNQPEASLENRQHLLSFAQQLYLSGEYQSSTIEFKRFLNYYPDSDQSDTAFWGIYHSYYSMGMITEAISVLPKLYITEENPETRIRIEFIWGSRYFELGKTEQAKHYFNYTLNKEKEPAIRHRAKILLGVTYAGEEKWDLARNELSDIPYDSEYFGQVQELNHLISEAENQKYRKPLIAGLLGIIPGLGYLYDGYLDSAVGAFVVNGLLIWGTYEAIDHGNDGLAGFMGIFTLGWYAGSIYGAVETANKVNEGIRRETRIKLGVHLEY